MIVQASSNKQEYGLILGTIHKYFYNIDVLYKRCFLYHLANFKKLYCQRYELNCKWLWNDSVISLWFWETHYVGLSEVRNVLKGGSGCIETGDLTCFSQLSYFINIAVIVFGAVCFGQVFGTFQVPIMMVFSLGFSVFWLLQNHYRATVHIGTSQIASSESIAFLLVFDPVCVWHIPGTCW